MTYVLYALIYVAVLFLQLTFANFMAVYGISPNFLVIYLVYLSLKFQRTWGSVIGFLMGIFQDAVSTPLFGVNAFSKTFSGFFVHLLPRGKVGTPIADVGLLIFTVTLVHDFLFNFIYSLESQQGVLFILLRYAAPGAVYTAVLGMMIKALFPKFLQVEHAES